MKKLLVIFMVLAMAAPAIAADNLSVNGSMRVRSFDTEAFGTFSDDTAKSEYVEQRFRMQATVKANDQVQAVTRVDLAEEKWGSNQWTGARYNDVTNSNAVIQVDRAYLDIATGPLSIRAGQQFMSVGQGQVYRPQKPGVQLTINTPVIIELGYMVEGDEDRGGVQSATEGLLPGQAKDEYNLHASVLYKADAFSVEGFYAQQTLTITNAPADDVEATATVFGVNGQTTVGPVKLNAELALFGGDNGLDGTAKTDFIGTQLNIDADMKMSDMFKFGVDLVYSDGTDSAEETKIAYVSDVFGRLNRSEGGSGNNIIAGDLAPLGGDDVFDPFNDNLGAMGLGIDATITPIAGFDILLHVLYLTAVEDAATDSGGYDDALVYNVGLTYALAPKAKIGLYYTAVAPSFEGNASDDTATNIGGLLQVAF